MSSGNMKGSFCAVFFLKMMFFLGCYVLLLFSSHVAIVDVLVVILLIDKCID